MDQNGGINEEREEDDEPLALKPCSNHHNCHKNFIRPSSSSSLRATSWSRGFGADPSEDADSDGGDGGSASGRASCCCYCCPAGQPDSHLCRCRTEGLQADIQNGDSVESQLDQCPTFYIEIPTVYLTRKDPNGSSSSSFHVYKVNIKTSAGAEWSIYRRYSQFLTLHQQLKACDRAVGKLSFPPKRRLNSKASTIVQERRRKLEIYMQNLCDMMIQRPSAAPSDQLSNEISPYKRLTCLATSGSAKVPRSSSRSGTNSLNELPDNTGGGRGSLSDSVQSERVDGNWDQTSTVDGSNMDAELGDVEQAVDVDEMMNELGLGGDEANEDAISRSPAASLNEAATDGISLRSGMPVNLTSAADTSDKSDDSKTAKSLRHSFCEFIAPQATKTDFELEHLGV